MPSNYNIDLTTFIIAIIATVLPVFEFSLIPFSDSLGFGLSPFTNGLSKIVKYALLPLNIIGILLVIMYVWMAYFSNLNNDTYLLISLAIFTISLIISLIFLLAASIEKIPTVHRNVLYGRFGNVF